MNHDSILVKVDGKWVFKEIKGKSATLRLAPGKHEVEAEYLSNNDGYMKTSRVIKSVVEVKEKGTAFVNVIFDGNKIRLGILTPGPGSGTGSGSVSGVLGNKEVEAEYNAYLGGEKFGKYTTTYRKPSLGSLAPAPQPGTGSGSVRGVLKNKETGTPVKNTTIPLLKVKSAEGGKVTLELAISPEGKMLGGMTTKTDGAGAFRFEEVAKGTPYVLGAVDNTGKNVVVLLSANDNVKDLGIVYQKKQSDQQKPVIK